MRLPRFLALLSTVLVTGCAEAPFVSRSTNPTIEKAQDTVPLTGTLAVCHTRDGDSAAIEALAHEGCGRYGLEPRLETRENFSCRMSASVQTTYRCVDPQMLNADGSFVNPFNAGAVANWERRTGRKAKAHHAGAKVQSVGVPTPEPMTAPEAQPPIPGPALPDRGLQPGDIAGKARVPTPSMANPLAPPVPPPVPGDFAMPMGSWGDHFQE